MKRSALEILQLAGATRSGSGSYFLELFGDTWGLDGGSTDFAQLINELRAAGYAPTGTDLTDPKVLARL